MKLSPPQTRASKTAIFGPFEDYRMLLWAIEYIFFSFSFSSFCLAVCPSRPPPCRSCVSSAKEVQALHVVALFYTDI